MNAITKALMDVKFNIPRTVLDITFMQDTRVKGELISLDDRITSSVIKQRVLIDSNLVGGVHLNINLSDCEIVHQDSYYTVVRVPKEILKNRSIVSALSIIGGGPSSTSSGDDSDINNSLNLMLTNMSSTSDGYQTARLELIGKDTVLIDSNIVITGSEFMRVVIENDAVLNNISPRSYIAFGKLVILAVKSYIYNEMVINIEKGYIYRGHELSSIQSTIDKYSDSEELYQEYLKTKWAKIQFMDDSLRYTRHLKHMFGNNL